MLDQVPLEILKLIVDQLHSRKDLKNACNVCWKLYYCATPKLYSSITVLAPDEGQLANLNIEPFLRTCSNSNNCLQYVRELDFAADIHVRLLNRCIAGSNDDEADGVGLFQDGSGDEEFAALRERRRCLHKLFFRDINIRLQPLLDRLQDDSLRRVGWRLGTCMPSTLCHYISERQRYIESLTVISNPACLNDERQIMDGSLKLPYLRHFSWTGNPGWMGLEAVGKLLLWHANQLETLELDFIGWFNNEALQPSQLNNFMKCLGLKIGNRKTVFPSLRTALLSAAPFRIATAEISQAFNISHLRTLRLRNCQGTKDLLGLLADSPETIRLTSFELTKPGAGLDGWGMTPLVKFLKSFQGLKELCVLCDGRSSALTDDYWRSILHHRSTLKRFVHQQREFEVDSQHIISVIYIRSLSGCYRSVGQFVLRTQLDFIGFCCSPKDMASLLVNTTPMPRWRLLHIRHSGLSKPRPNHSDDASSIDSDHSSPRASNIQSDEAVDSDIEEFESEGLGAYNPDFVNTPIGKKALAAMPSTPQQLLSFAKWAFCPSGLPELQILAYGDFSYDGRYEWQNRLFCRSQIALELVGSGCSFDPRAKFELDLMFREVTKADLALKEVIEEYSDMLSACPEDKILYNHY